MATDFPYSRSIVIIKSERTTKKTGQTQRETRYYLSSLEPKERTPRQWQTLIRGHWGGVEIRNHWRRDACMGEDKSRTRNPKILINLALMRSVLLSLLAENHPESSLPQLMENFAVNPVKAFDLNLGHL